MRAKEKTGAVVGGDSTPIQSNKDLLPPHYQRWMQKASVFELKDEKHFWKDWLKVRPWDFGDMGKESIKVVIAALDEEIKRRKKDVVNV